MKWTETEMEIMRDVFRLMKHNAAVQDTEFYWAMLTAQCEEILRRYNNHELALAMCVAACQFYEAQAKREKGRTDDGTGA